MNSSSPTFATFRNDIIHLLRYQMEKEYLCHLQFVAEIGQRLGDGTGADPQVVEIACLLHDIGRDKEAPNEEHETTGARLTEQLLTSSPFSNKQRALVIRCIRNHKGLEPITSLEEQLVISADGGSKIEYHEAFMLLCKKATFRERAEWGKKYLQRGCDKITIAPYREQLLAKKALLWGIYDQVLNPK